MLKDFELRRVSLRDQALAVIREALITGRIAPGTVHSAAGLATELGVSTSPVREAMLALVDVGLMESVPNKGFRAVTLTGRDLEEIVELRMLLEPPAMGRVAALDLAGRAAHYTGLVDAIEATAAAGDVPGNLRADREFHLGLLAEGGNGRLVDTAARLHDQTRLFNLPALAATERLASAAAEHRPLLAAVLAHDSERAEELTRRHLDHILTEWARSRAPLTAPPAPPTGR
jgi:DNA-binding GntR family transcriptional regulator